MVESTTGDIINMTQSSGQSQGTQQDFWQEVWCSVPGCWTHYWSGHSCRNSGTFEKKESTATPTKETEIVKTFENNGSGATPTARRHCQSGEMSEWTADPSMITAGFLALIEVFKYNYLVLSSFSWRTFRHIQSLTWSMLWHNRSMSPSGDSDT